jgi:surface carbohydrate biosynthesis protein
MKQRIYFTIETKVREFYARILFSILAAERGYSVVIGSRGHMQRFSKKLKKGIFLSNGNTQRLSRISEQFKNLGFKVGHLDEEGAITFDYQHHIFRFDFNIFEKIDFFFAVGEREKQAILSNDLKGEPHKKIYVSGNNRFDMLNEKFHNIYDEDVRNIKKKYGNFVLITTKFNKVNILKKNDEDDYVKRSSKGGYMRREIDHYFANESIKNDTKTMKELEIFLEDLKTNFPNTKFLLKPHPGENFNYWNEFKKKTSQSNLEIIPVNEFHTNAFILASDFLIASNCTTLLEGYLLNKLCLNFLPYENNKVHYELTKTISRNCYSKKELIGKVKDTLIQKNFEKKTLSEEEKKILLFTINNINENSIEKMLDYLDSLNFNDISKDKYSLYSNLFLYKTKGQIIEIFKKIFKKNDKYLKEKQEYLLQKNPGFAADEILNIKDKFCQSLKLEKDKFQVRNIFPGLYAIEKKF